MSEQSRLLRSLTKNEQMSESLNFLSESLIRSFFHKKRAICSENRWANSQPWLDTEVATVILLEIIRYEGDNGYLPTDIYR